MNDIKRYQDFIIDTSIIQEIEVIKSPTVKKVQNKETGQFYLQSQYPDDEGEDPNGELFFKHVRYLASLEEHPAIAKFIGYNLDERKIFTEFVDGFTLVDLINNKDKRSSQEYDTLRSKAVLAAVIGLLHIHEIGAIHRDLKPSSIRFYNNSDPKIVDFNNGKLLSSTSLFNSVVQNFDAFAAPETMNGSGIYDQKVDVYSFGLLVYYISSGNIPYYNLGQLQKRKKIEEEDFIIPVEYGVLAKLINETCLLRNPSKRMSMIDIVDAIFSIDEPFFENADMNIVDEFKNKLFEKTKLNEQTKTIIAAFQSLDDDLIQQANNGDVNVQLQVGRLFLQSAQKGDTYKEAFKYFQLAADQNNKIAMFLAARMLIKGQGCERNPTKAFEYLQIAQTQVFAARIEYAKCLFKGIGTTVNKDMAQRIFKILADIYARADAQYLYAISIEDTDQKEAFKYYTRSALNGCIEGKYMYAGCLYNGNGCEKNVEQAIISFEEAAEQGSLDSIIALGNHYYVQKQDEQAVRYFEIGANMNDPYCLYRIAFMLLSGRVSGKTVNDAPPVLLKAFEAFEKYERFDDYYVWVCHILGKIYAKGKCQVTPNKDLAMKYYTKGAGVEIESSIPCRFEFVDFLIENNGIKNQILNVLAGVKRLTKDQALIDKANSINV